ncbi:MAG: tetratricopeptide repeat protein [Coriobacteriia bacterium]|nr:tetratricopeptide repeat protein [Coriobacteriia bacterium]
MRAEEVHLKRPPSVLAWVVRGTAVLLVATLAYLGYLVVSDRIASRTGSPAGRAAETLMRLVRENPGDATLRVRLAEALLAAGRKRDAAEQFQAALKLEPDNANALSGLALIAMQGEEWQKAEGYWLKIIESLEEGQFVLQDQRLEKAYFYLGNVLIEQGRYEDAVDYLKRALVMRRDASDTHYVLSYAYWKLDIHDKRREHLGYALMFDPALPEANYDLGTILLEEGDEAAAAEHFRRSADKAPSGRTEPADALKRLGPFEDRLAAARESQATDAKAALAEARVALALEPGDVEAAKLVAALWEKAGDEDKAREAWDAVARLAPEDPAVTEAVERLEKGKKK